MIRLIAILFLSCCTHIAVAADIYPFSSPQESERFQALTKEFRCLVCQNQSLADSDATLAKDLRKKIYILMNEQKSDAEIRQFLVSRYGDFILFSPIVKPATWLLWGFPVFMLLLFLGWFVVAKIKDRHG